MEAKTVLLIAIPVLLVLAALLAVATTVSRQRSATGSLTREARKADRSGSGAVVATTDESAEGRARSSETRQSLEPAGADKPVLTAAGGLIRFGEAPADPETLGVSRRQFFNRSIVAAQSLVLGSFGLAVIGFLWPSLSGGFGGKVKAGDIKDILTAIADKKQPFYVPEARAYINPYPESALPAAKKVYSAAILPEMQAGIVVLFQKCVHLGCRVPWCQTSQWFECPCHGSKYSRVGEKKGGPAPRGLDRFPADVTGGQVTINTGIVVQGPPIGTNTTGQEAEGPNCV
ncbi:MAG: cytochrome b6-f complex iron-sulfur subunit [Actinomycetota bacterium]|jgi:cytochrome b6-f complex iron-sulfur subunit|nr:cytochrome b6-f complex iron-sulfur subunit [Actinomycetota bacterium]MDQ1508127.1 cytochrome b6-f complex iron-sulfur subunit [Actinomycetota bacterium]